MLTTSRLVSPTLLTAQMRRRLLVMAAVCILVPRLAAAQALTGALIGTVKDAQGGVLPGATVRVSSPALIGSPSVLTTDERGHYRFPVLPPGPYTLDIALPGMTSFHEGDIPITALGTLERSPVLQLAGVAESIDVSGAGSRIDARNPGVWTGFGPTEIKSIPTRRAGMADYLRWAPGMSPTSPSSGSTTTSATTISSMGSGTNENGFFFDGGNITCPCNGIARSEPGVDFIQEIQIQSVGASAEFGNMQGAVVNVITRQGSARFLYDASYYGQTARLTSQPVRLRIPGAGLQESGYTRTRYRDFTSNLGGPVVRDRLWFFFGYQYQRDYDSQPGTDPKQPRLFEQDKIFAKLNWQLAPAWTLVQSIHEEIWVNAEQPTIAKPFAATVRASATVPQMTFGHLTHMFSSNTVWDVRAGRFFYTQKDDPSNGILTTASHAESGTGITSGAPPSFGGVTIIRTTSKATISHYRPGVWGADHQWKVGGQFERGEHHGISIIPTGTRYIDRAGQQPFQSVSRDPSHNGGVSLTLSAFATDTITIGGRLTINAGVRFDHSRAISQDLAVLDLEGRETGAIHQGLGTLYTWNIWSPRFGLTAKLSADGRTMLRSSYGRFSQGVLTGEISPIHRGSADTTTSDFVAATGDYSFTRSVIGRKNLDLDRETSAPRTDEFSIGVDREIHRRLALTIAYIRKDGANFIGWSDAAGRYTKRTRTLFDGTDVAVFELVNRTDPRLFELTNQPDYSMTYNGLIVAVEKRRSQHWQAFGSYTLSRVTGLQPSSGTNAAGAQVSTVAPPSPSVFGRDRNDFTNAFGRLPGDRPHMFRVMGSVEVPRTGLMIAANLQHFSGKPWAARGEVTLLAPQTAQPILLEPRGSRRLSSQSLLDLRLSKRIAVGSAGRIELILDVLNLLNDTAEESLVSETIATESRIVASFGQPATFVDPRRAMLSVRLNLGR